MRILDLYCCEGGAAMGYRRAGFDVTGVDIARRDGYPFDFIRSDAITFLERMIAGELPDRPWLRFDAIHASPPCQAYSDLQRQNKREYPDLVDPTRDLLVKTGLPWVIENVEGAPLRDPVLLCGTMFPGLRVLRHRLFESNVPISQPLHPSHPLVFTHDKRKAHYGKLDQADAFVQVTGGGNARVGQKRAALGIDWMRGEELNEAIPPLYTEYVGRFLMRAA